jgi:hypothetical protein
MIGEIAPKRLARIAAKRFGASATEMIAGLATSAEQRAQSGCSFDPAAVEKEKEQHERHGGEHGDANLAPCRIVGFIAAIERLIFVEDLLKNMRRNWPDMAALRLIDERPWLASIVASTRCWLVVAHAGGRGAG